MFDAALNFREAYMEYIPNYPIAAYRIDEEMANNLPFKTFVDVRIYMLKFRDLLSNNCYCSNVSDIPMLTVWT